MWLFSLINAGPRNIIHLKCYNMVFFVCHNCKNNILIRAAAEKEKFFLYLTHVKDLYWIAELE